MNYYITEDDKGFCIVTVADDLRIKILFEPKDDIEGLITPPEKYCVFCVSMKNDDGEYCIIVNKEFNEIHRFESVIAVREIKSAGVLIILFCDKDKYGILEIKEPPSLLELEIKILVEGVESVDLIEKRWNALL